MADLDYFGADYGAEEPSRFLDAARNFGLANWAGAITSVGLTGAMAVWAVDLTFRDVSSVPVIAALEGPMRVAPEDPGGIVAPYQGMALSDITSGGAAAPAPEKIVLAPPPLDLDAPALGERLAAAKTDPAEPEAAPAQPARSMSDALATVKPEPEAQVVRASAPAAEAELQEVVGASAPAAEREVAAPVSQTPSEPAAVETAAVASAMPGLARSARPAQRPRRAAAVAAPTNGGELAAAVTAALKTVPTEAPAAGPGTEVASAAATRDIDPASVAPGTRVVQLGAFDSEEVARSEWDRLEGRFRDYMAGKARMIQKATSGGRDFWRLRVVGFEDGADARRFCSALLAQDAACIPVTVR